MSVCVSLILDNLEYVQFYNLLYYVTMVRQKVWSRGDVYQMRTDVANAHDVCFEHYKIKMTQKEACIIYNAVLSIDIDKILYDNDLCITGYNRTVFRTVFYAIKNSSVFINLMKRNSDG